MSEQGTNEELLFNTGVKLFNEVKQFWINEKNNRGEEKALLIDNISVFFPRVIKEDSNYFFEFIVYQIVDGIGYIRSKVKYSLSSFECIDYADEDNTYFSESIAEFNIMSNRMLMLKMAHIIKLCSNRERCMTDEEKEGMSEEIDIEEKEYSSEIEKLYDAYKITSKSNNNEIIDSIEEVGNIDVVDEEESTRVDSANETIVDIGEVDKVAETDILTKSDYDCFMEFIAENNSETQNYTFEWKNKYGLKYVTDDALKLVGFLIKYGEFKIKPAEREKKRNGKAYIEKYVIIKSKIKSLCDDRTITDSELLKDFEENGIESNFLKNEYSEFSSYTMDFNRICCGCKYTSCPKALAGYILYLKNTNKLKKAFDERRDFRKTRTELQNNSPFRFELEFKDGLKYVDEKIYQFSEELVKRNVVFVDTILNSNEKVVISSAMNCVDLKNSNADISKIPDHVENDAERFNVVRKTNHKISLCSTYSCLLDGCPYEVAGYIYYLRKSGQEDKIIEDRKFFAENREEVERIVKEEKYKKLEMFKADKNKIFEKFENFNDSVKNLGKLVDDISNKSSGCLYCYVQGEDERERQRFIDIVSSVLKGNDKIEKVRRMSLQNFMAQNVHSASGEITENDKSLCDANGNKYYSTNKIKYTTTEKNALYILNNISEFIKDFNVYKNVIPNYTNGEIKKKQFEHVISLMTNMSNSYIILSGNEKEKEALLELDTRIKYVYSNSVYEIPNLSRDEMFEAFKNNLKNELLDILRDNEEEYKKRFIEYIEMNSVFVPFSERQLVNYLAMYANSKNDVIEFPENVYKKETVDEAFKNIIGLQNVKNKVKEFEKYMLFQIKAKANNMKLAASNMHMIFTGNPGTGKTTFARIMAKMLYDLGVLKENKLIEVEKKDLIASYIGQTAPKTSGVIEKAIGGVLFIDEAYSITQGRDSFGKEAVATLIKAMEDRKDELVVIFAGYRDEMKTFLDSNSGIASRIGYTFDFPDYTPEELTEIFNIKMTNMGFEIDSKVTPQVNNICEYYSKKKAFGNGRFIDKLIQETIIKHSVDDNADVKKITVTDIPGILELSPSRNDMNYDAKAALEDIVGMDDLKKKVLEFTEYIKFVQDAQNEGINIPNQNMHMIFAGGPGTGKTTVARIMAKLLFDMGFIYENKLVEVERKDLVAEYIGQTAPKTNDVIEKAMGGVLFIDEAYSLASESGKDFGSEAIATLIKAMEDHKGEFVVIFAGYADKMEEFIQMNPGIASRIGYTFDFPDYKTSELEEIFYRKINNLGLILEEEARHNVNEVMQYFESVENIGNGRFVDKVLQNTLLKMAKNRCESIKLVKPEHIPTIEEMRKTVFGGEYMIDINEITEESLRKTATHEAGHATLKYLLMNGNIDKITIRAEGTGTLGYVRNNDGTNYVRRKSVLLNRVKVLLGGMIAEDVYFGEHANGNTLDLEYATGIVYHMITSYGMSDLGYSKIVKPTGEVQKMVFDEQNKILNKCYEEAYEIIVQNKSKMDRVIEYLLKNKEIDEKEFRREFEGKQE